VTQSVPSRWAGERTSPPPSRVKREPGENPGLPRSGEQERPPSSSTGSPKRSGKRRPVETRATPPGGRRRGAQRLQVRRPAGCARKPYELHLAPSRVRQRVRCDASFEDEPGFADAAPSASVIEHGGGKRCDRLWEARSTARACQRSGPSHEPATFPGAVPYSRPRRFFLRRRYLVRKEPGIFPPGKPAFVPASHPTGPCEPSLVG